MRPVLLPCLLLGPLLLGACGAGFVTGGVLANRKRAAPPPPEIRPPSLAIDLALAPLKAPPSAVLTRTVFLNDYAVRSSDVIRVELRALDVAEPQIAPIVLSVDGATTKIAFVYSDAKILERIPTPTLADVPAQLALLVEGREVAPPIPFLLLRQPSAELVPPAGRSEAFASVLGTTRITLRVDGLRATSPSDLQLQVATPDPNDRFRFILQFGSLVELTDEPATGKKIVSGILPPSSISTRALVAVLDRLSGQSTGVDRVFYGPAMQVASPRHGSTDGFGLVALFGQGMVPLDFTVNPPRPDFSLVTLEVEKGGRRTALPSSFVRTDLSTGSRLVVTLPPSPDGRAGEADLVLKLEIGASEPASSVARKVVVYGHREPSFGPRGVTLRERALDVAFARFESPAGAPDVIALLSSGGVPRVQLLLAEDNGTFARFQGPLDAALQSSIEQRNPAAICTGDFNGDSLADAFVVNQGTTANAEHTVVLGRPAPGPMLVRAPLGVRDAELGQRCATADFDRNGVPDVVVIQNAGATQSSPRVFLGKPRPNRDLEFELVSLALVGPGPLDAVDTGDLDGDGRADILFAIGGAAPAVITAYGNGDGSFEFGQHLNLVVPGYAPDASVPVAGLHVCGAGPRRSIVVVLAGRERSTTSPPCIAVLAPAATGRLYLQPTAASTKSFPNIDLPFGLSLAGDLDRDSVNELIVGARGAAQEPLRLLVWRSGAFVEQVGAVEAGVDPIDSITDLQLEIAVPGDGLGRDPTLGLFVLHRAIVDGLPEDRVSTWMVAPGPRLLAPDASQALPEPILAVASGDFRARGVNDLCCASATGVRLLGNDGVGGMTPATSVSSAIVPGTLTHAPLHAVGPGESFVWLQTDGRLAVLRPGGAVPVLSSQDLRDFAPPTLRGRPLGAASRLLAADVDGDGFTDLVASLALGGAPEPRDGEAVLLFLLGKEQAGPQELPVQLPVNTVPPTAHGNASSLALGNFTRDTGTRTLLELAVAIPRGDGQNPDKGNHVRFYRYDPPTGAFVRSYAQNEVQVLIAGDMPTLLAAADLNADGSEDLMVASGGDSRLRVFLNDAQRLPPPGREREVHIGAFSPALNSPPALPAGTPTDLALADLGGDGLLGAVVAVLDLAGGAKNTAVAAYRNDGTGDVTLVGTVAQSRTGNRVGGALRNHGSRFVLEDLNGDRRPDLAIGWESAGPGDRNLRLLFGGVR